MNKKFLHTLKKLLEAPHPTWQSKKSKCRVMHFLKNEHLRVCKGLRMNIGSGERRFGAGVLNLDLFVDSKPDIQADLLYLPVKDLTLDTIICSGVLEHVSDPIQAADEIFRSLKSGGRVFVESPFMQTIHVSPADYYRWTPDGLKKLFEKFRILEVHVVAGPASALAWMFQDAMALLFSFNTKILYKIGLRVFGWMAVPISWMDIILENNSMAWHAASGYAIIAEKRRND
jgi:SAM-dependent methyltransferase